MIRAQPMDAVVLTGGCDKTVPASLMGAVSADRPAVSGYDLLYRRSVLPATQVAISTSSAPKRRAKARAAEPE